MESWGKAILGAGIGHSFLQGVLWGKVGDCIDAFELSEWIGMTGEGLKRARNLQEFSLDR